MDPPNYPVHHTCDYCEVLIINRARVEAMWRDGFLIDFDTKFTVFDCLLAASDGCEFMQFIVEFIILEYGEPKLVPNEQNGPWLWATTYCRVLDEMTHLSFHFSSIKPQCVDSEFGAFRSWQRSVCMPANRCRR